MRKTRGEIKKEKEREKRKKREKKKEKQGGAISPDLWRSGGRSSSGQELKLVYAMRVMHGVPKSHNFAKVQS